MNRKLQLNLIRAFPRLYQDWGGDMRETCMAFGFECGDGWYPLIHEMSAELTAHDPGAVADQVKEKFGGLRFYARVRKEDSFNLIHKYELRSYNTCEWCGATHTAMLDESQGWVLTLCEQCREDRLEKAIRDQREFLKMIRSRKYRVTQWFRRWTGYNEVKWWYHSLKLRLWLRKMKRTGKKVF